MPGFRLSIERSSDSPPWTYRGELSDENTAFSVVCNVAENRQVEVVAAGLDAERVERVRRLVLAACARASAGDLPPRKIVRWRSG